MGRLEGGEKTCDCQVPDKFFSSQKTAFVAFAF